MLRTRLIDSIEALNTTASVIVMLAFWLMSCCPRWKQRRLMTAERFTSVMRETIAPLVADPVGQLLHLLLPGNGPTRSHASLARLEPMSICAEVCDIHH